MNTYIYILYTLSCKHVITYFGGTVLSSLGIAMSCVKFQCKRFYYRPCCCFQVFSTVRSWMVSSIFYLFFLWNYSSFHQKIIIVNLVLKHRICPPSCWVSYVLFDLHLLTGIIPQPNLLEESMGWSLCFVEITLSLTAMKGRERHEDSRSHQSTLANFRVAPRSCCATPPGCMFPLGMLSGKGVSACRNPARNPWARKDLGKPRLLERSWGRKWNDNHQEKKRKKVNG